MKVFQDDAKSIYISEMVFLARGDLWNVGAFSCSLKLFDGNSLNYSFKMKG
jgi:hypothetical protein